MVLNLLHIGKARFRDKISQAKIAAGILDRKIYNGPWEVQIDLTNTCNNDCVGCWCHSPLLGELAMDADMKKKSLSKEVVKRLIDDLEAMGTRYIYFTGGGEPFMHPHAIDIIEYVKKKGMLCDMSTNFTLVTKDIARRLVACGMDHMNISLWAGSPESYAATHPNKQGKHFTMLVEMLKFMHQEKSRRNRKKPTVHIYNVISNRNFDDFDNMIRTAYETKVEGIDFTPTDVVPGKTDSLMLSRAQADWLIDKTHASGQLMKMYERTYGHKVQFRSKPHFMRRLKSIGVEKGEYDRDIIGSMPCYAGWTFLRILANGNVNSCLKAVRIPIGNVYENSISEIWRNEKQKEFRRHTIDYDPENPFFQQIGNEHQKGNGCHLCCDNLGMNMSVHGAMKKMDPLKKGIVHLSKRF
jgi:MoaA/NifB/PqqE/SkfB family radical SAM enzyme